LFPIADFTANTTEIEESETVSFTDLSLNNPTSWHWYFEGGTPSESTEKNPNVLYETAGNYDVRLVVSNEYGNNELMREHYITVKPKTGIIEQNTSSRIEVYPNPTTGELEIRNYECEITNVEIYDMYGRKQSYLSSVTYYKTGEMVIDISHLAPGIYFLQAGKKTVKVVKL
jgi:PKD repeat protein